MTDEMKGPRKTKMPADWDEALDGEWDDEFVSEQALAEDADIELITEYLNEHLDPERMEQVRQRLDEDPAFRDLAAPLLLTWSIPTHLERHPRPVGELERDWAEFVRRTGFPGTQPPRKPHWREHPMWRRIRLPLLALLILAVAPYVVFAVSALVTRTPLREWYVTRRDFAVVPQRDGWIPLGDSIEVQFAPGTTLRATREATADARQVLLSGTARFRVLALDSITPEPRRNGIIVRTRGGVVTAGEAEFTVTARGDTTDVEVHRPSRRRFMWFIALPTELFVKRDPASDPMLLRELDRARLVRDRTPVRLTANP
jgi:hypothetical protein